MKKKNKIRNSALRERATVCMCVVWERADRVVLVPANERFCCFLFIFISISGVYCAEHVASCTIVENIYVYRHIACVSLAASNYIYTIYYVVFFFLVLSECFACICVCECLLVFLFLLRLLYFYLRRILFFFCTSSGSLTHIHTYTFVRKLNAVCA